MSILATASCGADLPASPNETHQEPPADAGLSSVSDAAPPTAEPTTPPSAQEDRVTAAEGAPVLIDVLENDHEAFGPDLMVEVTAPPLRGTATVEDGGNLACKLRLARS